jgi:hypothetical protein
MTVAVGHARFSAPAIAAVLLVSLLLATAMAKRWELPASRGALVTALGGCVLVQATPGVVRTSLGLDRGFLVIEVMTALGVIAFALVLLNRPALDWTALVLVSVTVILVGSWVILRSTPAIDVWHFTDQAARHILDGNIYEMSWTGIKPNARGNNDFDHGFPYLPMAAMLLATSAGLLGDVRFGLLLSLLLAGAMLTHETWRRGGRYAPLIGILLLLGPGTLTVVEFSFTEPLLLALLVGSLIAFGRDRTVLGVLLLALAIACKQHVVLLLPALVAWRPAGARRVGAAVGVAIALSLPWFVSDPNAFLDGTVRYHLDVPARDDAVTVTALLLAAGKQLPGAVTACAIVAVAVAAAMAVRRWQPELPGMALCLAFVLLAAGVMNKQSFLNQFWLASGLLLLALAPVSHRPREAELRSGLATGGGPEIEDDDHGQRRQQAVT